MKVFDTLLANIGRGHHAFADRWYTTRILIDHMTRRSQYFTGTVQINRKHFPLDLRTQHLVHMEARIHKTTDNKLLCVSWKDKKAKKPCF
ncbi:PiggyBac transposase uribo1 [Plakobranchus ocellatus]|uniref:PiggyBac transposase uribo1 n=1 Tax=Plakobranchus ocellatus TaxID=259542 RepID=A0AAV4B6P5_9GAST|nr:PiggyBac transposase uribo1 [Plakobranchus ocellatus]